MKRVLYFGRRTRFEDELDCEIRFHIEMRAAEIEETGVSRAEALAQARREFGSVGRMRDESRAAWQIRWIEDLAADLRYALRGFRRNPGFTMTAVLSLALGIGSNSAIFTALDAVLWKPLPVADPGSLVHLSANRADGRNAELPRSFIRRLEESQVFAEIATTGDDGLSFAYDGRAERVIGEMVSPNYFAFLGVQPILGQGFSTGSWAPEAVLSYSFWKRRFHGDPHVIGRTIRLNTYPFTIVGVSPPSFFGVTRGSDYELRIPILPAGQELAEVHEISGELDRARTTIARLKPGTPIAQAEAAADAQLQEFLRTTSRTRGLRHVYLASGARGSDGNLAQFHAPLYVLLALVGLVLLAACVNVAGMLLARSSARARELAVRISIGAGRGRLIRQMLTESVVLALAGGAVGVALAAWTSGALFGFLPQGHIPIVLNLQPDGRALAFTFGLSLLTGLLFGVAPAFQSTRDNLRGALIGAGIRKFLVAAQVAFSLVLLIAAGIFVRTLSDSRPSSYHVDPTRVLLFTMKPQQEIYSDDQRRRLGTELVRHVSGIPGVQSAALAENGPLGSRSGSDDLEVLGHAPVRAISDSVTPGFFETTGIPLIAGRDFTDGDGLKSPWRVIVNQALARELFPDENPLGKRLKRSHDRIAREFEIIGIVSDVPYESVHASHQPGAWFAIPQFPPYIPTLHVRTGSSDTAAISSAVRREFDALDKGFPVFNVKTFETRIEDALARERLVADLSAAFGMLALMLAGIGLYGILAYSVVRRTREIGIRMALGSGAGSVIWMIAREALALVVAGSLAGAGLALVAARILSRYIAGMSPMSAGIVAGCAAAMLGIAAVAVSAPAIRACRVDPLIALRHE